MTTLPNVRDANVSGRRVLLRSELNVTFKPGTNDIADDSRIRASLPTLELLRERGAKTVVCTHIGRPSGKWDSGLTVEPVRERMAELLRCEVTYAGQAGSEQCADVVGSLEPGEITILENLRFDASEEGNVPEFARILSGLADVYVNDAFGASHRAHASIVGVPKLVSEHYAGLLLAAEDDALTKALKPVSGVSVAVVGGAKVADKLALISSLASQFDWVLTGGGMVKAFVDAKARRLADLSEEAQLAKTLWDDAEMRRKIVLPAHGKITKEFSPDAEYHGIPIEFARPANRLILDIDGAAILEYTHLLKNASKIVWNGPMGVFEWPRFSEGTRAVAETIASRGDSAFTLAGGGSTAEALQLFGLKDRLTHVSTGGGATLEYLEGKTLPGIAVLTGEC